MGNDDNGPDLEAGIAISDLPEGAMIAGSFKGKATLLLNKDGRCYALGRTCTHLGAPLEKGLLVDGELRCPWHHARFSIETGEAIGAPAFDPLACFSVEQRNGRVFVVDQKSARKPDEPCVRPPQRVLVVGGGAGGHACAEMLVRSGFGGHVTVVSDDADPPYDRTFCSKQYLIGMVERNDCSLAAPNFYREGGPVLHLNRRACALDLAKKEVVMEDGERLKFDSLVLATGAEPKRPDNPGFDLPNVHLLRTLHDADALITAASAGKRAAVLGASFIGLEVAASLTQRDVRVEVISPDEVPLEKILGAKVGRMILGVHEEKGVRFRLGRQAKSFDGRVLTLDDGSTLETDFVVAGVGVAPRVALAESAGLAVASVEDGGGILVNERLETSVPSVFAIGDVARYPDPRSGKNIRIEHWVHAERQGQHVARVLMGESVAFTDVPFFWSAHFDTGLRYLGHVGRIENMMVDGSVQERDFAIRYFGADREEAFATCERDLTALKVEAEWDGGGCDSA